MTLDFWRIFIINNTLSTELATALTMIAITEGTNGQSHIKLRQTRPNSLRVMLYLEMYLDTSDRLLDEFFENVKHEQLDFTKVTGQPHPSPTERPGFHRLADKDPEARNASWTTFFFGIWDVICGLREKSKVDPSTAREDYFIPKENGLTHGMMMKVQPVGDLEPMSLWFGAEEIACQRVISLAKHHRGPKWVPVDEDRVSNSILAMKGRDILAFYNRNFPMSALVHTNPEFLEDETPDVTWQIQKLLNVEAEILMRRDPNRAVRLVGLASRKKPLAALAAPTTGKPPAYKSTDKSTTPKEKDLCRAFTKTGECRFGDSCRFGHVASADAPTAAANLPAAVALQDLEEDQMGPDLEEFTCGTRIAPECTKTFKTCSSFWVELEKKHSKDFVTPISCKHCRKLNRENWNNRQRRPPAKVDNDDKPVEVVPDLAMAVVEPDDRQFLLTWMQMMMTRWLTMPRDSTQI